LKSAGAQAPWGFESLALRHFNSSRLLHCNPMSDERPKSAYELAMERLRLKDKEADVEDRPLTNQQKAAIAEVRQFYKAKAVEREILHRDAQSKARTHEEVESLNENLRRDSEMLANDRDRKIAEIRRQGSAK
jgi:hypothetical protein